MMHLYVVMMQHVTHTWIWLFCNIMKLVWIRFTNFSSAVPVTRAAVTARVWRTNPRRSWRPTAQACRPESSQCWSPPSGLVCIPPTSPSTYPGVRCPGRTLWALAAASFSQRSWSGWRTRISSTSALILISQTGGSIYKALRVPRTRGDKAMKFLILGQSWM